MKNILEEDVTRMYSILKQQLMKAESRFIIKKNGYGNELKFPQNVQIYMMQEDVSKLKLIIRDYAHRRGFLIG